MKKRKNLLETPSWMGQRQHIAELEQAINGGTEKPDFPPETAGVKTFNQMGFTFPLTHVEDNDMKQKQTTVGTFGVAKRGELPIADMSYKAEDRALQTLENLAVNVYGEGWVNRKGKGFASLEPKPLPTAPFEEPEEDLRIIESGGVAYLLTITESGDEFHGVLRNNLDEVRFEVTLSSVEKVAKGAQDLVNAWHPDEVEKAEPVIDYAEAVKKLASVSPDGLIIGKPIDHRLLDSFRVATLSLISNRVDAQLNQRALEESIKRESRMTALMAKIDAVRKVLRPGDILEAWRESVTRQESYFIRNGQPVEILKMDDKAGVDVRTRPNESTLLWSPKKVRTDLAEGNLSPRGPMPEWINSVVTPDDITYLHNAATEALEDESKPQVFDWGYRIERQGDEARLVWGNSNNVKRATNMGKVTLSRRDVELYLKAHGKQAPEEPVKVEVVQPVRQLPTKDRMIPPLLKSNGGKYSLLDTLAPLLPSWAEVYIEVGCATAAVFNFWQSNDMAGEYFLIDLDRTIIDTYRAVKGNPDLVIKDLRILNQMHKESEEAIAERVARGEEVDVTKEHFYYTVARKAQREGMPIPGMPSTKLVNTHIFMRAAQTIYLNRAGFNGLRRVNKKGQNNVPLGDSLSLPTEETIHVWNQRLQNVGLWCGDFEKALAYVGPKAFVFNDVPYDETEVMYTKEGFTQDDQRRHVEFLKDIQRQGASFMSTNSNTKLIQKLYGEFEGGTVHRVEANELIAATEEGRGKRSELVLVNYEPGVALRWDVPQPLPEPKPEEVKQVVEETTKSVADTLAGKSSRPVERKPVEPRYMETKLTHPLQQTDPTIVTVGGETAEKVDWYKSSLVVYVSGKRKSYNIINLSTSVQRGEIAITGWVAPWAKKYIKSEGEAAA